MMSWRRFRRCRGHHGPRLHHLPSQRPRSSSSAVLGQREPSFQRVLEKATRDSHTCLSLHAIHTPPTCHPHATHTPTHTPPTCHPHATHVPLTSSTHLPHAFHTPPTLHTPLTCHQRATHAIHMPPTHHLHATHTPSTQHPHTLVYTCPHTQTPHHRGEASKRPLATEMDTLQSLHHGSEPH